LFFEQGGRRVGRIVPGSIGEMHMAIPETRHNGFPLTIEHLGFFRDFHLAAFAQGRNLSSEAKNHGIGERSGCRGGINRGSDKRQGTLVALA